MNVGRIAGIGYNYIKRGAKVYAPVVFGTGQELMGQAYKKALTTKNPLKGQFWKDLWKGTKEAGKVAERYAAKEKAIHGNFFKSSWESIKTIPKVIKEGWQAGGRLAKLKGKNAFLGKLGGAFKGIGKRMPVIGSLMIIGCELPNIIKATIHEGPVQGLAELAKAGARLGGGALLGAVGTALGGPIGGIVGWMLGEFVAGKIVGKSYSERVAEQEELAAAQATPAATPQGMTNPFMAYNPYQMMGNPTIGMNDDFMFNAYKNSLNYQA